MYSAIGFEVTCKLFYNGYEMVSFCAAVNLAEEVLAIRQETWKVHDVPNFTSLVCNFSSRQLASFCRVLAMVVFEPEVLHSGQCLCEASRVYDHRDIEYAAAVYSPCQVFHKFQASFPLSLLLVEAKL